MDEKIDQGRVSALVKEASKQKFKAMKHACFSDEIDLEKACWLKAAILEREIQDMLPSAKQDWIDVMLCLYAAGETEAAQVLEVTLAPERRALLMEHLADERQEMLRQVPLARLRQWLESSETNGGFFNSKQTQNPATNYTTAEIQRELDNRSKIASKKRKKHAH